MASSYLSQLRNLQKLGKPRVFRSTAHFDALVDQYMRETTEAGNPPTFSGMQLFLGFCSDEQWHGFPAKVGPQYKACIDRAQKCVENYLEHGVALNEGKVDGKKFLLETVHGRRAEKQMTEAALNITISSKDSGL